MPELRTIPVAASQVKQGDIIQVGLFDATVTEVNVKTVYTYIKTDKSERPSRVESVRPSTSHAPSRPTPRRPPSFVKHSSGRWTARSEVPKRIFRTSRRSWGTSC
jgi:hypothetical protein